MVKPHKLFRLVEQNVNGGKGVRGYKEQFRDLLGISENAHGEPTIDHSKRELHPRDFSFGEVARVFLGHDVADKLKGVPTCAQLSHLQEAGGNVVMPSHFTNINAFSDTIAGLLDAMILEAYESVEFIGDNLFQTIPARVQGGKMIGVRNDGKTGDKLAEGEPYPFVGLKETYVDVPDNERRGNAIQINRKVFLYDRTDQVQEMAANAGYATRRAKELRQADVALGIVNTYARDGFSANTYQSTAGTSPNDYVNSSANSLDNWTDIDDAIQVLSQNTDPSTGFEISVGPTPDLLVAPQRFMNTATIVRATTIDVRDSGGTGTGTNQQVRQASNPLSGLNLNLINMGYAWYNRLILATASGGAGLSSTAAQARWHLGNFKRAFIYRQIEPFTTVDVPVSSQEALRDIVMVRVAYEQGVAFVREPRYAYQGTIGGL